MAYVPVRKQAITKQLISMSKGKPYYFGFLSNVYLGEAIDHPSQKGREAPHMADVVDLNTGEVGCCIMPTVVVSELAKAYPQGIKGLCIEVIIIPPREGKKYNLCNLNELEAPEFFTKSVTDLMKLVSKPAVKASK